MRKKVLCWALLISWLTFYPLPEAAVTLPDEPVEEHPVDVVLPRDFPLPITEPGTEPLLIKALQKFGYIRMAENFSHCGNEQLSAAGQNWARQQGIQLSANKMGKTLHWGRSK